MIEYKRVVNHLKQNGYNEQENISDYWFFNHEKCKKIVNKKFPHHSQIFELQVRWKSAMGEACVEALKQHIEYLQEQARLENSRRYLSGDFRLVFARIDLNNFTFYFDEKAYTVRAVANAFSTSQIGGWHDLRGIPLDGIRVENCEFVRLNFSNASFIGASFQQVNLIGCNFVSASFDNARLVLVSHDQETALSGISIRGAFINAIALSDCVVSSPMRIKEIGYFQLVRYFLETVILNKIQIGNLGRWTRFQLVDIREVNNPLLRYQIEYINWSQSLLGKIDGFYSLPTTERISLLGSIILTKYWRSPVVLASFAVIAILIFTFLYMLYAIHFKDFTGNFLESLYSSVVMFTGYGNITPNDDLGRTIVMTEAVIGYLTLGSFLFILGQGVSQRY